jgi:two-component system chemotaxis response regulator CheY
MTVLIIDDSKLALMVLERSLRKVLDESDTIIYAADGLEAIEQYKLHKPDICFTDLTMPLLNGLDMIKELIKYDENAKIIVLSADVQQFTKIKALENGAMSFESKPIEHEKVIEIFSLLKMEE